MSWLETYRGTVYRWETDAVEHFTVAFYFERLEDATATLLDSLGLPDDLGDVTDCRVRYLREFRVADILHIRSGVLAIEGDELVLAHEVVDSATDAVCTTVEQRVASIGAGPRAAAATHTVTWSVPPEKARPGAAPPAPPDDDRGFIDAVRDRIKPWELDRRGRADWPAHIHRFTASNAQLIAAFGMTPEYMRERRRGFSTFDFRLRFAGVLRVGDPVVVRSALLHVGGSSIRIFHRLTNAATGELAATLEQSGVHLDLDARRPAPLPDEFRERARALLVGAAATAGTGG
jgi:acyl-CoA thioesterase FadM